MIRKLRATIAQLLYNIDSIRHAANNSLVELDHIRDSLWHIQGNTEALRAEVAALRSDLRERSEAPNPLPAVGPAPAFTTCPPKVGDPRARD